MPNHLKPPPKQEKMVDKGKKKVNALIPEKKSDKAKIRW